MNPNMTPSEHFAGAMERLLAEQRYQREQAAERSEKFQKTCEAIAEQKNSASADSSDPVPLTLPKATLTPSGATENGEEESDGRSVGGVILAIGTAAFWIGVLAAALSG